MLSPINKTTLEHLAQLARIKLDSREEEKLLEDLGRILYHFNELKEVDTTNIPSMTGGTELKNIFRDDNERLNTNKEAGVESFPKNEGGFLKIPPVFE